MGIPNPRKRFNAQAPTLLSIRENLRRLRKLKGLRLVDLEGLIEPGTTLTAPTLGRIESGERDISAVELMHLAIALQVTPNDLMFPWPGTAERDATIPVNGVSGSHTSFGELSDWWRKGKYPRVPSALAQFGASIEGQALIDALRDDQATSKLALSANPEEYQFVLMQFIWARYDRLYRSIRETESKGFSWLPELDVHANYRVSLAHPGALREITSERWDHLISGIAWSKSERESFVGLLKDVTSELLCLDHIRRTDLADSSYARFDTKELDDWIRENETSLRHMKESLEILAIKSGIKLIPRFENGSLGTEIIWPDSFDAEPIDLFPNLAMLEPDGDTNQRVKASPLLDPPAMPTVD